MEIDVTGQESQETRQEISLGGRAEGTTRNDRRSLLSAVGGAGSPPVDPGQSLDGGPGG